MKAIVGYLKEYFVWVHKRIFVSASLFIALFIFCNYYYGLQRHISRLETAHQFVSWFFVFLFSFGFGYLFQAAYKKSGIFNNISFITLLLLAPAIFAWKMVFPVHLQLVDDVYLNAYWNHIMYWPFKLLVILVCLLLIWWRQDRQQPFYGTSTRHFSARPYWIMLLLMLPLIAAAATQPDFLSVYPKLKNISFLKDGGQWWHQLLFELSYGSDFISIELFFRGFLILAFAKWVGKDAILPMALFYCTIHFGKPLGECISSFFGGIILGVVTYHSRTIWGGLMVHLGIAWLMEAAGYIGNLY